VGNDVKSVRYESPRNNQHYKNMENSVLNSQILSTEIIRHHNLCIRFVLSKSKIVFRVCVVQLRGGSVVIVVVVVAVGIFIFSYAKGWYEWRNAVGIPSLLTFMGKAQWPRSGYDGVVSWGGFAEWGCGAVGGVVGGNEWERQMSRRRRRWRRWRRRDCAKIYII